MAYKFCLIEFMHSFKSLGPFEKISVDSRHIKATIKWKRCFASCPLYLIIYNQLQRELSCYTAILKDRTQIVWEDLEGVKKPIIGELELPSTMTVPLQGLEGAQRFYLHLDTAPGQGVSSPWMMLDRWDGSRLEQIRKQTIALIPCYNAVLFIRNVVQRTLTIVDRVIIVDDGSNDGSSKVIDELSLEYPGQVIPVRLERNKGKGWALLAGYQRALEEPFQAIVALDADAQHEPNDLVFLADEILNGQSFVVGQRLFQFMPLRSKISNQIISFFLRIFYPQSPKDTQTGFRAFSRSFCRRVIEHVKGGCYEMEFATLLDALSSKISICSVPITTIYIEKNRSSHFSPLKDSFKIIRVLLMHMMKKWLKRKGAE